TFHSSSINLILLTNSSYTLLNICMTFLSCISLSFIPSAANFFILSLWYIWCSNNASENADLDISNICLSTRPFFLLILELHQLIQMVNLTLFFYLLEN